MKRSIAVIALAGFALAACGDPKVKAEPEAGAVADQPSAAGKVAAESATVPTAPATPAAPGAPAFAALYPGAETIAPATVADGPEGPGGMVEFRTGAAPDAVIEFYKQRAQAAGLTPVSVMNQGETRGYSATRASGAGLQVIALPDEGGSAVTLSWTAGR